MACGITVVIPAYNAGAYIEEALESVLGQTLAPDEIIVVDDASRDDTLERVRRFGSAVNLIALQTNSGSASVPRNVGIEAAHTEYIAQFDADDVMLPRKLERHAAALKVKLLPVCFHDLEFFGPRPVSELTNCNWNAYFRRYLQPLGEAGASLYELSQEDALDALLYQYCVGADTVLLTKAAWQAVGGYRADLRSAEDFDFVLRLAERFPFGYIDEVLLRYRTHYQSKMSNQIENYTYAAALRRNYLGRPLKAATKAALLRLISEMEIELAWQHGQNGDLRAGCAHWWQALRDGGINARTRRDSRKLALYFLRKWLKVQGSRFKVLGFPSPNADEHEL